MKRIYHFKLLVVSILLVTALAPEVTAQQSPRHAALRFANGSSTPGRVLFEIDGRKWRPDGFGTGESTTFIGIIAGAHRLKLSTPDAKSAEANLTFNEDTASTVYAYAKPVTDPQTHKTTLELQLLTQRDVGHEKGKHFYLLYASSRPSIDLSINGQPKHLNALQEARADEFGGSSINVQVAGKAIVTFSAEENGNFVVVIFDKADGTVGGTVLPDYG